LLAALKLQPAVAAEVDSVKVAVAAVQAAGPGAEAACEELEERCRSRLLFAAPADAPGVQAELNAIQEVQAVWQGLQAAAAEREQQGIQLPAETAAAARWAQEKPAQDGFLCLFGLQQGQAISGALAGCAQPGALNCAARPAGGPAGMRF
jgi:hypothetical protein